MYDELSTRFGVLRKVNISNLSRIKNTAILRRLEKKKNYFFKKNSARGSQQIHAGNTFTFVLIRSPRR